MERYNPDYNSIFHKRAALIKKIKNNPILIAGAIDYYSTRPKEFINHWCITYDPRNATAKDLPTTLPFITFTRQDEMIDFLLENVTDQENGMIEKSRDMGATWIAAAFSVWMWRFVSGSSVGWGSRKQELVDRLGDPDSIFEKLRMTIDYIPRFFWPEGFSKKENCLYMKIINPDNGATITGESGDNIGRGGRKSIYFKDESAYYERPEMIEAALADNTNVQIDISSVPAGTGNIFTRRREASIEWKPGKKIKTGKTRLLILDWRDHPKKTQEWYERRRTKAEEEGLLHVFAREVDRDSSASAEGVLIPQIWVKAAIDAHNNIGFTDDGDIFSSLDVADEGGDKNAQMIRKGVVLRYADQWAEGDTGDTARKSLMTAVSQKATKFIYDSIGVGAGVKAESNRMIREKLLPKSFKVSKWIAGAGVFRPKQNIIKGDKQTPLNKDFYANLKAQGGWQLRLRFEKTYRCIVKKEIHSVDELISIDSTIDNLQQICKELSQPTYTHDGKGRIVINKKPKGTKSPNFFDSISMN
ncbi:MAG: hypothetical protein KAR20_13515, partial [Candidatus Heimdallarchaeota archaeon]|nr:hypothetical protein [Candidatus Heimdallarchaeota archaeon]